MDQHFCTACGHQLGSGDLFCTACGTRVDGAAPVQPAPPAAPDATAVRRAVPPQPPTRRRRSRAGFWGWIGAAAVLVAVVSFGLGVLTNDDDDNGHGAGQAGRGGAAVGSGTTGGEDSAGQHPTTGTSPDPQALAQAQALHTLIDHSAADKHRIAVAAAQLQSCRHVKQGIHAFEEAADSRDQLVDDAAGLQVGLLPDGGAAIASFSEALRASADADRAYVAYGQKRHQVASGKRRHHHRPRMTCTGGRNLLQTAVRLSSASHSAKQQTAKEWNLIAAQFKLPKVAWTSL